MSPSSQRRTESAPNTSGFSALIQEKPSPSNAIEIPEIALPRGGGALRGIDETFEVNGANGTGALRVPLPVTPGRNGFTPSLALSYNSGGGNGPWGLGWSLDYPAIRRRTDKQLPNYGAGEETDTFVFSGADDLVPRLVEDAPGEWEADAFELNGYQVRRYRPRIEGLFARIEQITHATHGTYWKVTTRDNVATIFGRSPAARIFDPENETRIFSWLPEFSYDDKGNWMRYRYKPEDTSGLPDLPHERNRRNGLAPFTNLYLKRVEYGNRQPYYLNPDQPFDPQAPADEAHLFELVFDYGEHHTEQPTPAEVVGQNWPFRTDAFSEYRAGFEMRTQRLCRRVLMFHHFEELGETPCLVRALEMTYAPSSINGSGQAEVTYLTQVTQAGFVRRDDGTYSRRALPPLELQYETVQWNTEVRTVRPAELAGAPVGLSGNYQWVDLYGEGINGILTEQGEGWFYKHNLGDLDGDGQVRFSTARQVAPKPTLTGMASGVVTLQDLDASGEKQLVVESNGLQGFFELEGDGQWVGFRAFEGRLTVPLDEPQLRRLDLDGDGRAELVLSEENAFVWYPSNGKLGYRAARYAPKPFDEERGPAIVFADQQQSIFLADMSGDGLTDIVRIRNGEVCYWPNKGYGRFGARINMTNAPLFDHPDQFDPRYLQLADVSGTGATDLLYLGKRQVRAWLNLSGNAWGETQHIGTSFPMDPHSRLTVTDLLGNGTSCIVWSSDLPEYTGAPLRYIDLMNGRKPHLLRRVINNLGKETTLSYRSSTYYYLQDQAEGRPWATRLPFPVHLVSEMTVEDKISEVFFTSSYRYHHGYYDHAEREFRGFGLVEQEDTEQYETWRLTAADSSLELSPETYQPPVLTRTWFQTGAFREREQLVSRYETEQWFHRYNNALGLIEGDAGFLEPEEPTLPDLEVVAAPIVADPEAVARLSGKEWREALRACKGMVLRREVFALDAPAIGATDEERQRALTPYNVATHTCRVHLLQPRAGNEQAVFMVTENESLELHYERRVDDPRVSHSLNLVVDELGQVLESAAVVYPRRQADLSLPLATRNAQNRQLIIYRVSGFTTDQNTQPHIYRLRQPASERTYELTGWPVPAAGTLLQATDLADALADTTAEIAYSVSPSPGVRERRLIEHVRTLYYDENVGAPLPFGQQSRHGLRYESYQLAFTPALLQHLYEDKLPASAAELELLLGAAGRGRYLHQGDGNWWVRSGVMSYRTNGEALSDVRNRFFSPTAYTDPFGSTTRAGYLGDYFLLLNRLEDALGNVTQAEAFNFRSLAPRRVRDVNNNLSEVLTDELGLVKAMALLGKGAEADALTGLTEETPAAELVLTADFLNQEDSTELLPPARQLLSQATVRYVYDFNAYSTSAAVAGAGSDDCTRPRLRPAVVAAIRRERHHAQDDNAPLQIGFEYSDGLGKVVMTKAQAEPGPARRADVQPDCTVNVVEVDTAAADPPRLRWLGNGRTVFNNKGKAVKQYEPYFSVTPAYEDAKELVETGVTAILHYDSAGRMVKTLYPDGTISRTEFDAWRQLVFDRNDTVLETESTWHAARSGGALGIEAQQAAQKTEAHAGTPTAMHLDTLGRSVCSVAHHRPEGGADEFLPTLIDLDIEGNVRQVTDALGLAIMTYRYDMLGHRAYQHSLDSGERWVLTNCTGNPIHQWDGRGHRTLFEYDELQRPASSFVEGGPDGLDHEYERITYGDHLGMTPAQRTARQAANQIGRSVEHRHPAGRLEHLAYDFKGNLLHHRQTLLQNYQDMPDWSAAPALEDELFDHQTSYDALDRPVQETLRRWAPLDAAGEAGALINQVNYSYNEASLLHAVSARAAGQAEQDVVTNIDYNEKGQRSAIFYGNGTRTNYSYDPETFRLTRLLTTRGAEAVQDLRYTYDPEGSVTAIRNEAEDTLYFNNQRVEPGQDFTYDPLYRLIRATGRDHVGQAQQHLGLPDDQFDQVRGGLSHPGDGNAMQVYHQHYLYDAVGNMREMTHRSGLGAHEVRWRKTFEYNNNDADRALRPGQAALPRNNQLLAYEAGGVRQEFNYDEHGNMEALNATYQLAWDFLDQLRETTLPTGQTLRYTYDGSGRRARKVVEDATGIVHERIYFGAFEVYRERGGLERETLHVQDGARRVALIESRTAGNDASPAQLIRYQLSNHLGTVGVELDATGNLISYEEYYPFGGASYRAMNGALSPAAKRYRFTGQERDEETGLYYQGARYYACWLARWTRPDPLGLADGINAYRYVGNNPVKLRDPGGTEGDEDTNTTGDPLEEPPVTVTPLLTDTTGFRRSGPFNFSGHVRSSFGLEVPSLSLNTTGLLDVDLQGTAPPEAGVARVDVRGGLVLGEVSGLHLTTVGQGFYQFPLLTGEGSSSLPATLRSSLTTGEGEFRLHGGVGAGSFQLGTFRAEGGLSAGRFHLNAEGEAALNLARFNLSATGAFTSNTTGNFSATGNLTLLGGLSTLDVSGTGTFNPAGANFRAGGQLHLFGIPSLQFQGTGAVSSTGDASFAGTFSGYIPPINYATGDFSLSSSESPRFSVHNFGLTYTPDIEIRDPSPIPAVMRQQLQLPADPSLPSGPTIGYSFTRYDQGRFLHFSVGVVPSATPAGVIHLTAPF